MFANFHNYILLSFLITLASTSKATLDISSNWDLIAAVLFSIQKELLCLILYEKLHVANYPPSLVLFHRKNQDAFKGAVLVAVQLPA